MAKQTISIGTVANDHTGDPLRTAFTKVNANFTELYAAGVGVSSTGVGGVSRIAAVTLDATKSIHKLTSGWYYLPNGVEGKIIYLTLATGSTPLDIKVDFQHARINESANAPYDNGPIFSNVFGVTLGARPPSLVTAIFIDGAWVCSPDGVWD